MAKPKIGLIGCFQNGKSTLVNCCLANRIAASGDGVAKTKRVVRYLYGEKTNFAFVDRNGTRRSVDSKAFVEETTRGADDGSIGEATICASILREVDLIDTPGFDACQEDVDATTAEISNFDFAFFVVGGSRGGFDDAEKEVLRALRQFDKPFAILYNCSDLNSWNPKDELVALRTNELESVLTNFGFKPRAIRGRVVFPVNLAWRWRAVVVKGVDEKNALFEQTEAERRLARQIERYFDGAPTSETLNAESNFDWIYDYVVAPVNPIGIVKNSIPSPSLNVRLVERQAKASWNFIDDNYSFELAARKTGARFWSTLETRKTEEIFDALDEGSEYEFRIRAVSNDRRSVSPFCDTIRFKTPEKRARVTVNMGSGKRGLLDY